MSGAVSGGRGRARGRRYMMEYGVRTGEGERRKRKGVICRGWKAKLKASRLTSHDRAP